MRKILRLRGYTERVIPEIDVWHAIERYLSVGVEYATAMVLVLVTHAKGGYITRVRAFGEVVVVLKKHDARKCGLDHEGKRRTVAQAAKVLNRTGRLERPLQIGTLERGRADEVLLVPEVCYEQMIKNPQKIRVPSRAARMR